MDVDRAFIEMLHAVERIANGSPRLFYGETFTIGAFDLALTKLRDSDAFVLLSRACAEYKTIKDDDKIRIAYIELLADLAHASATTELPPGMEEIIRNSPAETGRLQDWYRIKCTLDGS